MGIFLLILAPLLLFFSEVKFLLLEGQVMTCEKREDGNV